MKIPNNVIQCIAKSIGWIEAKRIEEDWFYLTLNNFKYIDDGDALGFINCHSGRVYMGHLFKNFSNDWKNIRLYYNTVRRIQSRIVEIPVYGNLFFFKKVKPNDAFGILYLLNGIENGNLTICNKK